MAIYRGDGTILNAHQLQGIMMVPLGDNLYDGPAVAPDITTMSLNTITQNTAFSQTLTATGTPPITWSVSAGSLPAGITLSSAGLLSGTTATTGAYSFTVVATNATGSDAQAYSGSVQVAVATAPVVTTAALNAMTEGVAFTQTLAATGTAPITWSVTAGSLPAGLTLASGGLLSGTPTVNGAYNFTVSATNSAGSDTQVLSGTIQTAAATAPVVTTAALNAMTEGVAFTQTLAATGTAPITWSVTVGSLPAGLSLSSGGLLSGTPSADGAYSFTVTATNAAGNDAQAYSGTVDTVAVPLVTVMAQDLDVPWSINFLPNGDMLVAERAGRIRRYGSSPYTWNMNSESSTEGGLMGLALHPDFAVNGLLYVYFTIAGGSANQIDQYLLSGNSLTFQANILTGIPANAIHNGGVIKFGPDGKLYVCVGDANVANDAQDLDSLAGKILRINPDGSAPADNPFMGVGDGRNEIWSYGHRNPQGLAWDDSGRLWSTEHGPFPGEDEINVIEKGANYGWPVITGGATQSGMKTPVLQSTTATTWAPSGCEIHNGVLYFSALRGQALYAAHLSGATVSSIDRHFYQTYGRMRAVSVNNGLIYAATSNRDHNGGPLLQPNDDKVLRINPSLL